MAAINVCVGQAARCGLKCTAECDSERHHAICEQKYSKGKVAAGGRPLDQGSAGRVTDGGGGLMPGRLAVAYRSVTVAISQTDGHTSIGLLKT